MHPLFLFSLNPHEKLYMSGAVILDLVRLVYQVGCDNLTICTIDIHLWVYRAYRDLNFVASTDRTTISYCRLLHLILLAFNALSIQGLSAVSGGRKSVFAKRENVSALLIVASQVT